MYLGILVLAALGACNPKEAPQVACKKMDQSGTTCLDGAQAQVSVPTTATGTGGGLTQEQMMALLSTLQTNFQTNQQQRIADNPNQTVGQFIGDTEQQLRQRNKELNLIKITLEAETTSDHNRKAQIVTELEKIDFEISENNKRLAEIAEARKEGFLEKYVGIGVGLCVKDLGACGGFLGGVVNWGLDRWGNKDDDGPLPMP